MTGSQLFLLSGNSLFHLGNLLAERRNPLRQIAFRLLQRAQFTIDLLQIYQSCQGFFQVGISSLNRAIPGYNAQKKVHLDWMHF